MDELGQFGVRQPLKWRVRTIVRPNIWRQMSYYIKKDVASFICILSQSSTVRCQQQSARQKMEHTLSSNSLAELLGFKLLPQANFKFAEVKGEHRVVEIDEGLLPYIFMLTQKSLSHSRLSSKARQRNQIACQVYDLLKSRIIPKRKSSRTGRAPTRMKYEQKIKFVMRSMEEQLARMYFRPVQKMMRFNIEEQRTFFERDDVQQHFYSEMPKQIVKRIQKNNEKINEFTDHINEILQAAKKGKKQHARYLIDKNLKSSQMPWSQEMFQDIRIFALSAYREFVYRRSIIKSKCADEIKERERLFMERSEGKEPVQKHQQPLLDKKESTTQSETAKTLENSMA